MTTTIPITVGTTTTTTTTTTTGPRISPCRIKIYFQDDEVRRRSELIVQQLFMSAMDQSPGSSSSSSSSTSSSSSNSSMLAKKALKYRNVLSRMDGVDVTSPEFDASKFLGVDWCKTESLKDHCLGQPEAEPVQLAVPVPQNL